MAKVRADLPDIEAILRRGQVRKVCDSFCFCLDLQVGVLDLQEFFAAGSWLSDIHQGAEKCFLTAQLRQMEDSGLLTRKVYAEVPPRVEYTLTPLGYSLKPIMDAMWAWGEHYKEQLREAQN